VSGRASLKCHAWARTCRRRGLVGVVTCCGVTDREWRVRAVPKSRAAADWGQHWTHGPERQGQRERAASSWWQGTCLFPDITKSGHVSPQAMISGLILSEVIAPHPTSLEAKEANSHDSTNPCVCPLIFVELSQRNCRCLVHYKDQAKVPPHPLIILCSPNHFSLLPSPDSFPLRQSFS
jgi:hypothetical protein